MDRDGHVVGVLNGVLDLDLYSDNPKPRLCNVYSKYFVSKCANARYIEYNKDNPYIKMWKKFFREVIVEKDARHYKLYREAAGLDEVAICMKVLQNVADGANAKSAYSDNCSYVKGDYSAKLSTNLIFGKPRSGSADPELMQTKGLRSGVITETDGDDKLKGSRIKTISERVKTGRDLFNNIENFDSNLTVDVYSNFTVSVSDSDYGLWRRLLVYRFKCKFVESDPDIANGEKLADPTYADLAMRNPDARDALFSILVHYRIKLQKRYGGNLDKVPCETIRKETEEFRKNQDKVSKFLMESVVILYGHNAVGSIRNGFTELSIRDHYEGLINETNGYEYKNFMTLAVFIKKYKEWYKEFNAGRELKSDYDEIRKQFLNSKLSKFMEGDAIRGIRVISSGSIRIKGESFVL
jgi:hypothetical protein